MAEEMEMKQNTGKNGSRNIADIPSVDSLAQE